MKKIIGVKFRGSGKVYYFDPQELEIKIDDAVIVETARGTVFGTVCEPARYIPDEQTVAPLKPVIRVATEEDKAQNARNVANEAQALATTQRKIEDRGLEMKLVGVDCSFDGFNYTFYYTSENRVDFRELLKDLTRTFRAHIELRQIGVRDEAKKCGGLGSCGRPICCSSFLESFMPVSIKMAKTQNLSLSSAKISGVCGRLMCCLKYEQESYEYMQRIMPIIGSECVSPDGKGTVLENNAITETTKVKVVLPDGTFEVRTYPFRELEYTSKEKCDCCACEEQSDGLPPEGERTIPESTDNVPEDSKRMCSCRRKKGSENPSKKD